MEKIHGSFQSDYLDYIGVLEKWLSDLNIFYCHSLRPEIQFGANIGRFFENLVEIFFPTIPSVSPREEIDLGITSCVSLKKK